MGGSEMMVCAFWWVWDGGFWEGGGRGLGGREGGLQGENYIVLDQIYFIG